MTITAKIIADSISEQGIRLTTMQLRYPRFIHAEFMTHRALSRNASSSRAIPVKRLIEDIRRDPAIPIYWGKNQAGMQAWEEHQEWVNCGPMLNLPHEFKLPPKQAWLTGMETVIRLAEMYAEAGYHKQIVNRLLEPWAHINVVVTATEWANFYTLRRHADAQPEIKALADAMWDAQQTSTPQLLKPGEWHLPYITIQDWHAALPVDASEGHDRLELLKKISTARCGRVSYLTHDGRPTTIEEDAALFKRLVGSMPLHASPAEHQATPDSESYQEGAVLGWDNPHQHGNLRGWRQHRKLLPGEFTPG